MVIYCWAASMELEPRKERKPAGVPMALTELTNAFLLHELYKSHAV